MLWQLVDVVRVTHVCCVASAPLFESSSPKPGTFLHMLQLVFRCVPSREDEKLFAHQLLSLQWFGFMCQNHLSFGLAGAFWM